jgi:hypothetical protein
MMPPWKRKASVVVPWAILIGHEGFERSSVAARSQAEGWGYNTIVSKREAGSEIEVELD